MRSEIKAKSQQAKPSANVEAFTLLTLGISDPRVKTLEDAITAFTAPETLDGGLSMLLQSEYNSAYDWLHELSAELAGWLDCCCLLTSRPGRKFVTAQDVAGIAKHFGHAPLTENFSWLS